MKEANIVEEVAPSVAEKIAPIVKKEERIVEKTAPVVKKLQERAK